MIENYQIKHSETTKRRYSSVLLLAIFSTQVATAAILENLILVTRNVTAWTAFYYILSLLAAIPQSGFSDDSGRKKHLLIASSCVLAAAVCLLLTSLFKTPTLDLPIFFIELFTILPTCFLLGVTGNAIPIARGCLATIKVHDFRASIGLTSVFIGLGWVTVNLLSFILSQVGVIAFSAILQLVAVVLIVFFYNFHEKQYINVKKIKTIIFDSFKWCGSMLLVAGGAAALGAYLLTETAFYQIYIIDELHNTLVGEKVIGLLMGFAYLSGVVIQWIINPSDKNSIKFGAGFSFLFLLMFFIFNYKFASNNLLQAGGLNVLTINGLLQFLFAFGFGFSVPALFSLMSKNVHPHHTGRLFGAVDTADTGALGISWILLYLKDKIRINNIALYSIILVLFVISLMLYYKFMKVFKTYEKD